MVVMVGTMISISAPLWNLMCSTRRTTLTTKLLPPTPWRQTLNHLYFTKKKYRSMIASWHRSCQDLLPATASFPPVNLRKGRMIRIIWRRCRIGHHMHHKRSPVCPSSIPVKRPFMPIRSSPCWDGKKTLHWMDWWKTKLKN